MSPDIEHVLATLDVEFTAADYERQIRELGGLPMLLSAMKENELIAIDGSSMDWMQLREWLVALAIAEASNVLVVWPFQKAAFRLRYSEFIEFLDELWYPAADDVILMDFSENFLRAVLIDHEERLSYSQVGKTLHELYSAGAHTT